MPTHFLRHAAAMLLIGLLCLLSGTKAMAGLDDCLKTAFNAANPEDLKKAAAFASKHPSCLSNLAPPTLVPYVALSGSLDAANQSGALNQVGLGFSTYQQCADKVNPGKAAVKQLAPVLKPVCGTLNMDCSAFDGPAADEVNSQLASEVPLLSLLPCSCAVATSGLGAEKIAELVKDAKKCGATFEQVAEAFSDAAEGIYDVGGDAVELGKDAANEAIKLGESVLNSIGSVGCAISTLWGGCGDSPPPIYKNTATAICKAHGSTWWAASKTQAPNDIFVQCNDGLYCWAQPGESLRCEQRRTPAQRDSDIAAMKQWCPQREAELEAGYQQQCHDGLCKIAVTNVASKYGVACMKIAVQDESDNTPSAVVGAEMKDWQGYRENLILSQFDQLIIESIQRDPKTPPVELLATYQCRPFLGRPEQSLCQYNGGYQKCKQLVDAGKIQKCFLAGGGEYPLPGIKPALIGALGSLLQSKPAPAATAPQTEPAATRRTETATVSNSATLRAVQASTAEREPMAVSDSLLNNAADKGCLPYQGRRDELQCDNRAGYDECVQAVNRQLIWQCRNSDTGEVYPNRDSALRKP